MSSYVYKAKKENAQTVVGQIMAQSEEEAIELISRQGLLPISVAERRVPGQGLTPETTRVKGRELYLFSRHLVSLLKGGISLLRALDICAQQTTDPRLKAILQKVTMIVRDGGSFSESLAGYPQVFSPLYVAMVKVGEESGNLKEMVRAITEHQRGQEELALKIRNALIYPVLMLTVGVLTVIFILTFVMPRITALMAASGQALPLPTQILMKLSAGLQSSWWWLILVIFVFSLVIIEWGKTVSGRMALNRLFMSLPGLGEFLKKAQLGRFCRTLELLLKSGVAILRALQLTTPLISHRPLQEEFQRLQQDLAAGSSLAQNLKNSKLIPTFMVNLISVGEESGNLSEALADVADHYELETNESIKTATTLIEPCLILLVGLVIGFLVMAMLLPVFQIDAFGR